MGKLKTEILIVLLIMSFGLKIRAQDVSFSQFYSNPLYLNPAFAGSLDVGRAAVQYRNQWSSFSKAFNTYSLAFDFPVKKLQGGLGFFILNDSQAANSLQSIQVNAVYSVFVKLSENYRLQGAIQAGFHQNSLRTDKLIFPDNLDPFYGNHGISREIEFLADPNFSFFDFSTGVLLYNQKIFGGLVVHHLAEPRQSFYPGASDADVLHRKYTAHFGARLPVFLYGHHRKKFDISPQLVMQYQRGFGQMNYGFFATQSGLTAGAWFRQNFGLRYDAVILLAGFAKNRWQINYTYDIAVSGLWGNVGGTSEISLVFLLRQIEKARHLPFYNTYEDDSGFQ
ncbi:PorP/SprF family type IX secretion system membrane protein [Mariniphaga sp.]|uniref:PorP/SprF family type IX secretion system membrane protein n=1 Tax=Mariniphaga sp. TaxID=1954475 RepID=UPI0035692A8A